MKYSVGLLILLVTLAACSTPPADVPRAQTGGVAGEAQGMPENTAVEAQQPTEEAVGGEIKGTVPIDPAESSFEFEGYGVGKSHVGTFETMSGTVTYENGVIIAAEGIIDASSVKTDSGGLDNHLQNEDFFHVEEYPEIRFSSNEMTDEAMVGTLTFHGVTREITIPLTERGERLSAEFMLSMKDYGIEYTGVNDEVRIAFTVTG